MGIKENLASIKPTVKELRVEGWDFPFYVRILGGEDLWQFANCRNNVDEPNRNVAARALTFMLCEEDGNLVFSPGSEEGLSALGSLDSTKIIDLLNQAMMMNGLNVPAVEEAKKN